MSRLWILYAYLRTLILARVLSTRGRLESWQRLRVSRFLKWVMGKSPFYRRWFEGVRIADWQLVPWIDKKIMMENFTDLNTRGVNRERAFEIAFEAERTRDFSPTLDDLTVGLSSGTSGSRGLFLVSPKERFIHAGTMLAKVLPGSILERHRVAFFLRANSNLYSTSKSRLLRFEFFDLLETLDAHVARLNQLQPTLIFAPPSQLRQLAEASIRGELRISPRRIFSVAETLDPLDERRIAGAFGIRVHQVYQCTEGFLGVSCREGTLHLNEENLLIEKEWLDRAAGKFVPIVTDFSRTTQPIIRYRLNDILTLRRSPCPCGSPTTAIDAIEGRCDDLIYLDRPGRGGAMSVDAVTVFPDFVRRAILMASDEIDEYRVVQKSKGALEVALKLSPVAEPRQVQLAILRELESLSTAVGARVPEVTFSENFPALGLKKLRRVESQLERVN